MSDDIKIINDKDLEELMWKHRHKLMQLDTPIRYAGTGFDIERSLRDVMYKKNPNSEKETIITKSMQIEFWDGIINFQPDPKDGIAPVFVVSHQQYDKFAIRKALEAMSSFIERGYKAEWYTLSSGFTRRSDIQFKNADVLFISNIVSSSTPHKLEILRDVVSLNNHCLRVIVTAGWHGKDLANATQLSINGLIHIKGVRK